MTINFNQNKIVGETYVLDTKSSKEKEVIVEKIKTNENKNIYTLKIKTNQKILGQLKTSCNAASYLIYRIDSFKQSKYKLVGTRLIQVAIESSDLKGYEGVVKLISESNSLVFYYKLGMLAYKEEINQEIALEIKTASAENRAINTSHLPAQGMSNKNIALQALEAAKQSPILYKFRATYSTNDSEV
ncbi:MAG: hypothetical protein V4494_00565 [Chlamydiota bacterium]